MFHPSGLKNNNQWHWRIHSQIQICPKTPVSGHYYERQNYHLFQMGQAHGSGAFQDAPPAYRHLAHYQGLFGGHPYRRKNKLVAFSHPVPAFQEPGVPWWYAPLPQMCQYEGGHSARNLSQTARLFGLMLLSVSGFFVLPQKAKLYCRQPEFSSFPNLMSYKYLLRFQSAIFQIYARN